MEVDDEAIREAQDARWAAVRRLTGVEPARVAKEVLA